MRVFRTVVGSRLNELDLLEEIEARTHFVLHEVMGKYYKYIDVMHYDWLSPWTPQGNEN